VLIDLQRAGTFDGDKSFKRLADVCLQGQCFEWMWVLVKCLKMRGLWLPWEGSKDLALAYSRSDTMLENKRKREDSEHREGEEGRRRETQGKIKDYIVADFIAYSDYKMV